MDTGVLVFWIVAGGLAAAAGLVLLRAALAAPGGAESPRAEDMAVYRDQLSEVDRDVARGTLTADEAGRVRTEVSRRLLDADRAAKGEAAGGHARPAARGGRAVTLAVVALALAGSVAAYAWLGVPGYPDVPLAERIARAEAARAARPAQAEAVAKLAPAVRRDPADPATAGLIARLRAAVAERPSDRQGLQLLAENESALGNWAEAALAWRGLIAAKGAAAAAGDYAGLADALVLQAGGYVSPEAGAALAEALKRDPGNGTARFYMGLAEAQVGRPDLAFRFWAPLLEQSPPGAPWNAYIRDRIGMLAMAAGVDYAPPPEPGAGGGGVKGPTAEEMAAAREMSPEDRQAMIGGMVQSLSDRLATQGGSGAEWAQLIVALGVLGDRDNATAIWTEARGVFAASPDDLAAVNAAAAKAGLEGAPAVAPGAEAETATDAPKGPAPEDIEAARDMAPEDRQAMIEGMVARLSDRLAAQGGSGAEWAQLIVALGVLGNAGQARAIWTEAQGVFAASPGDLAAVNAAAAQAGLTE
ncbi:MAG: c-type cytochrome biogenesis protein CcmI [Paracoccaceae bacterium]